MTAAKTARRPSGAGRAAAAAPERRLPEVDVARFEELSRVMEQLVAENASLFVSKGQEYRQAHREGTRRPLTAQEAAQIASAIDDDRSPEQRAVAFQTSELSAYDEPDPREVLIAAGVATAPAFIATCRRVVALVEMPTADFWAALDDDRLDEAVHEAALELRRLGMAEARERTAAAMRHWAAAAGQDPGKAGSLLGRNLLAALEQAMTHLLADQGYSSLIASPPPTTGPGETFSDSPGERPAS